MKYLHSEDTKVNQDNDQAVFEEEQKEQKDFLGGYRNMATGKTYNGLDV